MNAVVENLNKTISTADEEISRASAVKDLIKAKEESIDLQLEAAYRERLQQVHRAVHRRLVSADFCCSNLYLGKCLTVARAY